MHQKLHCLDSECKTSVYIQAIDNRYAIRWFNPSHPIQRCGHGTLAAAAYLQQHAAASSYSFNSDRETLLITRETEGDYCLELPTSALYAFNGAFPFSAKQLYHTPKEDGYIIALLDSESSLRKFTLNDELKAWIKKKSLIITSTNRRNSGDVIFRYFAPYYGENEDNATGSAAPILWSFWREHIIDNKLNCYQASKNGGYFSITSTENKVLVHAQVKEA